MGVASPDRVSIGPGCNGCANDGIDGSLTFRKIVVRVVCFVLMSVALSYRQVALNSGVSCWLKNKMHQPLLRNLCLPLTMRSRSLPSVRDQPTPRGLGFTTIWAEPTLKYYVCARRSVYVAYHSLLRVLLLVVSECMS